MDKSFLVQITNELYRLTLLFPKKEPLRYKMREVADTILAQSLRITNQYESTNTTENRSRRILDDLEVLESYFEVAKSQNWIKASDILNLQKEYSNLRERSKKTEINTDNLVEIQPRLGIEEPVLGVSLRQEKILGVLKEKGRAQVWEIKQIFPQVSKRTLRRDFENLFKNGIVERIGERNDTFYRLKA